jgi:BlaI family penicillinase repressor
MYVAAPSFFQTTPRGGLDLYPREVRRLFRREREIAMIVYDGGLVTANEVGERLPDPLSNPAVRSMLNRLVEKGVLTRQMIRRGRYFLYGPAVTVGSARETVLRQFAVDFYDGSLEALAEAIADMLSCERPPAMPAQQPVWSLPRDLPIRNSSVERRRDMLGSALLQQGGATSHHS